jgi:hypothetical protein
VTAFELVALGLSFILGLGITQLLSSVVAAFRARRQSRIHWMPLVWALCVFVLQLQYWWAIFGLRTLVKVWTFAHFGTLLVLALTLFVAGALMLPDRRAQPGQSLLCYFTGEGRWAVAAQAAYHIEALVANATLFGVGLGESANLPVWVGLALTVAMLVVRPLWARSVITVAYLTILVWVVLGSGGAY